MKPLKTNDTLNDTLKSMNDTLKMILNKLKDLESKIPNNTNSAKEQKSYFEYLWETQTEQKKLKF